MKKVTVKANWGEGHPLQLDLPQGMSNDELIRWKDKHHDLLEEAKIIINKAKNDMREYELSNVDDDNFGEFATAIHSTVNEYLIELNNKLQNK
ncbi:hypothetical protein DSECCO2_119890 [anaerobic digester metagenome]